MIRNGIVAIQLGDHEIGETRYPAYLMLVFLILDSLPGRWTTIPFGEQSRCLAPATIDTDMRDEAVV